MKKFISVIMVIAIFAINSGCVSYIANESTKEDIRMQRALSSGDAGAIATARSGGDLKEFGIDPTYGDSFKEKPFVMSLAAIADIILFGGGAKLVSDEISDSDNGGSTRRDTTNVSINGDGNAVEVSGDVNNTTDTTVDNRDQNRDQNNTTVAE